MSIMASEDEELEKQKHLKILHQLKEEERQLDAKLTRLKQAAIDREAIMKALHEYNDIKDATQTVLGLLADVRGVTVKELHEEFDLPVNEE